MKEWVNLSWGNENVRGRPKEHISRSNKKVNVNLESNRDYDFR